MGAWLPDEIQADPEVWSEADAHGAATDSADAASRAMYLDQRMYLGDGVLVKVDRAAGAHGVEVRSPFLDHTVVELFASDCVCSGPPGSLVGCDCTAASKTALVRQRSCF